MEKGSDLAVVEAVASGVPTFVNDWVVMRVFKDFLRNWAAYEREAVVNAKVIREKFSIERHMKALSGVYERVVNEA